MDLRYQTLKESEEMLKNELALERQKYDMNIDKIKREEVLLTTNNIALSDEISNMRYELNKERECNLDNMNNLNCTKENFLNLQVKFEHIQSELNS